MSVMSQPSLFVRWLVANIIGFVIGSQLGATNDGLLVALIPGRAGVLLGDVVFGAAIGALQRIALQHSRHAALPLAWIPATAAGFAIGARSGAHLAFELAALSSLPVGVVFGGFMGLSVGAATLVSVSPVRPAHVAIWLGLNTLAWTAGEALAFSLGFTQAGVTLVAVTIASVTWAGLGLIRPFSPSHAS